MVFSSLIFLYGFFSLSLLAYSLCRSRKAQNWVLLVFSLVFYAWGEPKYVLLLMFMAFASWACALGVEGASSRRGKRLWVLLAAVVSAVTRPFGVHGLFYKICGKGVGGIDGFYFRSSFDRYKQLALINPPNPVELCNALEKETGIPVVLMDANDIEQNQLGKCDDFPLTDEEIQDAMADNPSGQGDELTPLILIRPIQ